ncbi:hypothetical protein HU200_029823 [Digitaria exilis]|uniref:DUF3615 domain-containing protein n=1 Tax=Digitaria exilis TaxID=1010633 RepID=A0A835C4E3_9POAL|nr:hypothetical protein HU200_029823 [Digitaria exilis]
MASSTEIMHADQETIPIVGGGPAPDTRGKQPVVDVTPPRHNNPKQVSEAASSSESTEALMSTIRAAAAEAEAKVIGPRTPLPGNRRWWRRLFPPDPLSSIPVGQPLDAQQERMLIKKALRPMNPWNPKRLAMERQIVRECLHHYNIRNPGNEYEPAPGMVIQYFQFGNGTCWTHGNFVARQKRYGCFSLLPAPRTLFFYEQSYKNGSPGVVTCTPLGRNTILPFVIVFSDEPLIPFARRAIVALMIRNLAYRRSVHVETVT